MLLDTMARPLSTALLLALSLACGGGDSTGLADDPAPGPGAPPPPAQPGSITGIAVDGTGAPIAGAKIWIRPAVTTGLLEATTDANGRYSVQGLATIPYRAYAWTFVQYGGRKVCLRLGAEREADYDSFVPTTGVVRNFRLKVEGEIGPHSGDRFGGDLRLFIPYAPNGERVIVTLTPTGPLIDGSAGRTLTYDATELGALLQGIPVGVYQATARFVSATGAITPLTVSAKDQDDYAADALLQWQTRDSCIGSSAGGPDRAFLWIRNPAEE
jgi:hypothetical protein